MSSEKKKGPITYSKTDQVFEQEFLSSLQALNNPSKRKIAAQDLKENLKWYADSSKRVNTVLSLISSLTENSQKVYSKPEAIRVLGMLAEIFQGHLIEFTPKILQLILSNLSQDNPELHDPLKDVTGKLVKYVLGRVDPKEGAKELKNIFKSLWRICRATSKSIQIGAAMCISEGIQSSKKEILREHVERVALKVTRLLKKPECRAKFELLKCLMILVVSVDDSLSQLKAIADIILPCIVENIESRDWNVKKLCFTIIHSLSENAGDAIAPYKRLLMEAVAQCKHDKMKEVQDSALNTIESLNNLKDVPQEKAFAPRKSVPRSHSRSAQKERSYAREDQKDYERKRPGILKDSRYDNSPSVFRSTQGLNPNPMKKTIDEKMALGPFSAKNQRNIRSEHSLAQFYTPNGMLTNQINYYPNEVSNFEVKYTESHYLKRPDAENINYTPSASEEKNKTAVPSRSPQVADKEISKPGKVETSSDEVSTRQFTGDMERDGSKKSNASSPMHPELTADTLAEILSHLYSIDQKQNMLKQGVDNLRLSTQDDLGLLRNRLNQLEGLVGKLCVQQKETNFSTRTSAIFSDYNPFKASQSQFFGKGHEEPLENGREIERQLDHPIKRYQEPPEKGKKVGSWDFAQEGAQNNINRKDSESEEFPTNKPLLGQKLEECLRKKAFTEAFKLCLEEGDQDITLYLMMETGPVIEKLKGNLGEVLLNKLKTKLFDSESRPILLDWIERALFVRAEISRATIVALKETLGQILKYHRDLQNKDKNRVEKIFEYLDVLAETLEGSESKKEERV